MGIQVIDSTTAACSDCGLPYARARGRTRCRECSDSRASKESRAKYWAAYSRLPEVQLKNRERALRNKYGMGAEDYDLMLQRQNGVCGICKGPPQPSRWGVFDVDHDHDTGVVRGLLCMRCNVGIGRLDTLEKLDAARSYLLASQEVAPSESR